MASTDPSTTTSDLDFAETLWKSADALRGQVDAAEYKHVVLGLLFLKYISDSFEARRERLDDNIGFKGGSGYLQGTLASIYRYFCGNFAFDVRGLRE